MKRFFIGITVVLVLSVTFFQTIRGSMSHRRRAPEIIYATTIILDAGHGGKDGGASSADGTHERDIVLVITKMVEEHLRLQGFNVVMTRSGDADLASPNARNRKKEDLARRVDIFNTTENAIAISIHANAIANPRWSGAQTFYDPKRLENEELATHIMTAMRMNIAGLEREQRPISNIYVLRNSEIPTALVEVGFLSNPSEARLLACPDYQRLMAYAIFEGILSYIEFAGLRVPIVDQLNN